MELIRLCRSALLGSAWRQHNSERLEVGGLARNRTGVHGFAVRCVTTPPRGHSPVGYQSPGPITRRPDADRMRALIGSAMAIRVPAGLAGGTLDLRYAPPRAGPGAGSRPAPGGSEMAVGPCATSGRAVR